MFFSSVKEINRYVKHLRLRKTDVLKTSILSERKFEEMHYLWRAKKYNPTGAPRQIDVDSTWILRRYVDDQISTNFNVISTYIFDEISLIEKSTSFPYTFFDGISMVQKSMSFSRTFSGVILLVEISTLFPRTFFDVISFV